jgi:hypothetical protein
MHTLITCGAANAALATPDALVVASAGPQIPSRCWGARHGQKFQRPLADWGANKRTQQLRFLQKQTALIGVIDSSRISSVGRISLSAHTV